MGLVPHHFLLGLFAQTQALQERRCLGILHGLVLCSCILYGRDLYLYGRDLHPCIWLPPDPCSGMLLGPDLCPRILYGTDVLVLFHGPDLWSGILYNLYWGILKGLYDLCPCMFLGRPGLILLKQGFG